MIEKHFKNLDEQINIMITKGLKVSDPEYTKKILLRENYFFINGYRHLLLESTSNEKKFIKGSTFEELYSIFLFDRSFRNILFKYLLVIENNIKSIISYQLSKKYGYREKDYLRSKNFNQDKFKQRQVNDLLKKMNRQIRVNGSQHSATMHYSENYGYIPLWILVKVLSFGIVSEMYNILKIEDQKAIADIYNVEPNELITFLQLLANYRNLCAHEDILYNNRTQKEVTDTVYHKLLNIKKIENEYNQGKNDLFALIIVMKHMLDYEEFNSMTLELEHVIQGLNYNIQSIKIEKVLTSMGFPLNWKELSTIKRSVIKNGKK